MKKSILILVFAFVPSLIFAQNKTIDSLTKVLKNTKDVSDQIRLRCEISQQWIEIGELVLGEKIANKALAEAKINKDKSNVALAYYSLGRLNQYHGYLKEALSFHNQAMPLFEELHLNEQLAWTYLNIGITQRALENLPKAIEFDKKALTIFKKIENKQGIAYSYINLGLAFDDSKEHERAMQQMLNAKNICLSTNDIKGLGYVYHTLGNIYENTGDYDEAVKANLSCFPLKKQYNDKMGMALSYANLTDAYFKQGSWKKSEQTVIKGEQLAKEVNSTKALSKLYLTWARLDSINGNYQEALAHFQKHTYNKSVLESEKQRGKISELEHSLDVINNKIAALQSSNKKTNKIEEIGIDKLPLALGSLVVILLSIIGYLTVKIRVKTTKK